MVSLSSHDNLDLCLLVDEKERYARAFNRTTSICAVLLSNHLDLRICLLETTGCSHLFNESVGRNRSKFSFQSSRLVEMVLLDRREISSLILPQKSQRSFNVFPPLASGMAVAGRA